MGADGVVDAFPLAQLTIELIHLQRAGVNLIELLGVSAVGALDRSVQFGGARGRTNRCRPRGWQACSNSAATRIPRQPAGRGRGRVVRQASSWKLCCFAYPVRRFVIECGDEKLSVIEGDLVAANSPTAWHFCGEPPAQMYIRRWFESICATQTAGADSLKNGWLRQGLREIPQMERGGIPRVAKNATRWHPATEPKSGNGRDVGHPRPAAVPTNKNSRTSNNAGSVLGQEFL